MAAVPAPAPAPGPPHPPGSHSNSGSKSVKGFIVTRHSVASEDAPAEDDMPRIECNSPILSRNNHLNITWHRGTLSFFSNSFDLCHRENGGW